MTLNDVIARLDGGEASDELPDLARAVARALDGSLSPHQRDARAAEWRRAIRGDLNTVVALLPEGWTWGLVVHPAFCNAWAVPMGRGGPGVSAPVSPARALLLALLRTHAAMREASGDQGAVPPPAEGSPAAPGAVAEALCAPGGPAGLQGPENGGGA